MDLFKKAEKDLKKVFCEYITEENCEKKVLEALRFVIPPANFKANFSTNAAMIVHKTLGKTMNEVANELAHEFRKIDYIKEITVVGGYINLIFKDEVWDEFLVDLLAEKSLFGNGEKKQGKTLLEFVSANPTGPLHVGHCRGAILGLALSRLLKKSGYNVQKEYYVNDYGEQVVTLLRSVQFRYEQCFGFHKNQPLPEGCYPGEYLEKYAKTLAKQSGNKYLNLTQKQFHHKLKKQTVEAMMDIIREDLSLLGLQFDTFSSEAVIAQNGEIERAISALSKMKKTLKEEDGERELPILYKGILSAPLGGKDNAEEDEVTSSSLPQTLFRSTLFGDDKDRVVLRSDGKGTYFASDIAYHKNKIDRGFTHLINILGADHGGYVKRLKGAVNALSNGETTLDVLLCQMVNLEKDGVPFKMSKRKGTFVLLRDVVKEVDVNELKLYMLSKSADTQMSFDLVKVKEKSKDNLVYYIQYAYARTFSVLQKYEEVFKEKYQFSPSHFAEFTKNCPQQIKEIVLLCAAFPHAVQSSAERRAPNILVEYLNSFASKFHSLWNADIRLVQKDSLPQTQAMMAFVCCVQTVLENSFDALGIEPKRSM